MDSTIQKEPTVLQTKNHKLPLLENVLKYQNENIIRKFMENYSLDREASLRIFNETKKWLWLCACCSNQRMENKEFVNLVIDDSMLILDEMWHTFILFTRDYTEFCLNQFGFYIHHAPTTFSEKEETINRRKKGPKEFKEKLIERTQKQYSFIYDHLGEETLETWYRYFPKEYSKKKIKELKK